jgi:hypothetical protein
MERAGVPNVLYSQYIMPGVIHSVDVHHKQTSVSTEGIIGLASTYGCPDMPLAV